MSAILSAIQALVQRGDVKISDHGYDELAQDGIFVRDLIIGLPAAQLIEEYPSYGKGPCILVLQRGLDGRPIHAVWGIPRGATAPAVLVTAYRPDPPRWSSDYLRRRP